MLAVQYYAVQYYSYTTALPCCTVPVASLPVRTVVLVLATAVVLEYVLDIVHGTAVLCQIQGLQMYRTLVRTSIVPVLRACQTGLSCSSATMYSLLSIVQQCTHVLAHVPVLDIDLLASTGSTVSIQDSCHIITLCTSTHVLSIVPGTVPGVLLVLLARSLVDTSYFLLLS